MSEKKTVFISDDICRQDENGKYHLYGSVCTKCGHKTYPGLSFCPVCLCQEQDSYDLEEEGTIHSYTVTRVKPTYGHFPVPHPIAFVDVPGSESRVTAPLYMEDEAEFKIGAKVKMQFDTYWEEEDQIVIGPKYRVVKEGGEQNA